MNASEVLQLKGWYKDDIVAAQKKYDELLEKCTHLFADGRTSVIEPAQVAPFCSVCGRVPRP